MNKKIHQAHKPKSRLSYFIIPLILLVICIGLLATFNPAKFLFQSAIHKLTNGGNPKNFDNISDPNLPLTNNASLSSLCNIKIKYSTDVFKDAIVTDKVAEGSNNTQVTLNHITNSKDSTNLICLKYSLFSNQLRSLVEGSWTTSQDSEKRYGMNLEQLKALEPLEFYKKYTLVSNNKCIEKSGVSQLSFVSSSASKNYQDKYIDCDLSDTELRTKDFILLPKGKDESLLLIRFVPYSNLSSKILVF
jgi:hypothetical protein